MTLFAMPVTISILLELRFVTVNNEYQMYSLAVCCGLVLIFALFWFSLWVVVMNHYQHREHPLVLKRFGFIFQALKKSGTVIGQSYLPLMTTKRFCVCFTVSLLTRYTVGPMLIILFFQILVSYLNYMIIRCWSIC